MKIIDGWFYYSSDNVLRELGIKPPYKCEQCKFYGLPIRLDLTFSCMECEKNNFKYFKPKTKKEVK